MGSGLNQVDKVTLPVGEGLSVTVPADEADVIQSDVKRLSELFMREQQLEEYIRDSFPKGSCRAVALQKLAEMTFWLGESLIRGDK